MSCRPNVNCDTCTRICEAPSRFADYSRRNTLARAMGSGADRLATATVTGAEKLAETMGAGAGTLVTAMESGADRLAGATEKVAEAIQGAKPDAGNENDKHYDRVRAQIEHEDELINHRLTRLFAIEAFMLTLFGVIRAAMMREGLDAWTVVRMEWTLVVIFLIAAIVCVVSARHIRVAELHLSHLREWWWAKVPDDRRAARATGFWRLLSLNAKPGFDGKHVSWKFQHAGIGCPEDEPPTQYPPIMGYFEHEHQFNFALYARAFAGLNALVALFCAILAIWLASKASPTQPATHPVQFMGPLSVEIVSVPATQPATAFPVHVNGPLSVQITSPLPTQPATTLPVQFSGPLSVQIASPLPTQHPTTLPVKFVDPLPVQLMPAPATRPATAAPGDATTGASIQRTGAP